MIYVIATLKIQSGSLDEFLEAAKVSIAATREEEGCIFYDLNQSLTEPDMLTFVERWESRETLMAHSKAPHMKVWRDKVGHLIEDRKLEIIEPAKVDTP